MQRINYKSLKIIALSDTHGQHRSLSIPKADIIIHCGDACEGGDEDQLKDFFDWFSALPIKHKIFVAGNHDLVFDLEPERAKKMIPANVILMENSLIVVEGIIFYSLIARPWMHEELRNPIYVDILITHGPPLGVLDEKSGCPILHEIIEELQPVIHLFGHIHSLGGKSEKHKAVTYYNVCSFLK